MWYVILIHQTYRIALTWHYFVEFMKNMPCGNSYLMLFMTLDVHSDLMVAEGFYTSPTCSSLTCAWTNGWASSRDVGDLRCHRTHYGVTVMFEWMDNLIPQFTGHVIFRNILLAVPFWHSSTVWRVRRHTFLVYIGLGNSSSVQRQDLT